MPTVYTVRMGWLDSRLWSAESIVGLYRDALKAAGFASAQLPAVAYPVSTAVVNTDGYFRRITINTDFGEFSQTRDTRVPYTEDTAKLAELGRAYLTVYTWNLCHAQSNQEGVLRDILRKTFPDVGTLKLAPRVSVWELAAELEHGYPQKQPRDACVPATGADPAVAETATGWGAGKIALGLLGLYLLAKR